MSFDDLYRYANRADKETRIWGFSAFYINKRINGLHYINFDKDTNIVTIRKPNHSIEYLSTIFLKNEYPDVNSALAKAQHLKKFLDFLLIWDIDLTEVNDPVLLLGSFAEYLQLCPKINPREVKVIEWATLRKVPLSDVATNMGKVISLGPNQIGKMKAQEQPGEYSTETIFATTGTAVKYLVALKQKTLRYRSFPVNKLPITMIQYKGNTSGTIGDSKKVVYDVKAILKVAKIEYTSTRDGRPITMDDVFTKEEVDKFLSVINTYKDPMNKLLFLILKCFGLREGEAANLTLEPPSLPSAQELLALGPHDGMELIKQNVRGDLRYDKTANNWICSISLNYRNTHKNAQVKSTSSIRDIKLLFPDADKILEALYYALIHRELLMQNLNKKERHNYLFVSGSNNSAGKRIYGSTVYSKFSKLAKKFMNEIDVSRHSPHSFRHFFATYLINDQGYDIFDISRFLGHKNEETTRNTYLHFLPRKDDNANRAKSMNETLN